MPKRNEIEKVKGPEIIHLMDKIDELVDAVNDIYRRFQKASESLEEYQSKFKTETRRRTKNV